MRVHARTRIAAPPQSVWSIAADPASVLAYMSGVTRWEAAGEHEAGLGARYRVLFRLGAAEIGGLIEMVEWNEPFEFAWTSVRGVEQRGRLRLRPAGEEHTRAELRMSYGIAGSGVAGWIAERLSGRAVAAHLRRTLRQLGREAEHEVLRARAAERQR